MTFAGSTARRAYTMPRQNKEHDASLTRSVASVKDGDDPIASTDSSPPHDKSTKRKSTKMKQRKYERKTDRFVWPDELHRCFVAAIFDLGLKNASPKALLSVMGNTAHTAGLTTERLKSHLQKYRLNYERSRQEFFEMFDDSVKRSLKRKRSSKTPSTATTSSFVMPVPANSTNSDDPSDADESVNEDEEETQTVQQSPKRRMRRSNSDASASRKKPLPRSKSMYQPSTQPPANSYLTVPNMDLSQALASSMNMGTRYNAQLLQEMAFQQQLSTSTQMRHPFQMPIPPDPNDPQWNILNMLLSPRMMPNPSTASEIPTLSTASVPDTYASEAASSHVDLADIHRAMCTQMSIHRQMLNRKVEVSHVTQQEEDPPQSVPVAATQDPPSESVQPSDNKPDGGADMNEDTLASILNDNNPVASLEDDTLDFSNLPGLDFNADLDEKDVFDFLASEE